MMQHSIIYDYAWATIKLCAVLGVGAIVLGFVWVKWIKSR